MVSLNCGRISMMVANWQAVTWLAAGFSVRMHALKAVMAALSFTALPMTGAMPDSVRRALVRRPATCVLAL